MFLDSKGDTIQLVIMKKISIVIPCHNEAKNITPLTNELMKIIPKDYNSEIILVDDGSIDETPIVIKKLCNDNSLIKGILLQKNFGQQAALMAGVRNSEGDAVITMDADFQHPPKTIPALLDQWQKGKDLVLCQKSTEDRRGKESFRNIGYLIWQWITDGLLTPGVSEFMLMDKKVVKFILKSKEKVSFLRGLAQIAAKNPEIVTYKVGERKFGKSSYNLLGVYNVFINGLVSFSTKPLRITSLLGLIIFFLSLLFLIFDVVVALVLQRKIVSGYLTIVFLMALLNGFIIFYLGILGEYIGVIFKEVKARPKYLINEKINFE